MANTYCASPPPAPTDRLADFTATTSQGPPSLRQSSTASGSTAAVRLV
ncbi:hypothetical protein HLB23_16225 [Nocardia uniformis]|uniref:Uncharacterized protein n=1 Tax=Nocardia uniformis TaxID=53432 RepID=A0A849BXZ2_9NOCA|nr:hypothetical protein [Nocardia uniformis]NNH71392.1 hypothetical protein [Nocardia uniformis]